MTIGIYGILNTINYKIYIGKSKNIEKRFRQHLNFLSKNVKDKQVNRFLFNAVKKYGLDNFEFLILETFMYLDEDLLSDAELNWIDLQSSTDPNYGYNLTRSSSSLVEIHPSTILLQSGRSGNLNSNYGNKWSEEQKNKQREIRLKNNLNGTYNFMKSPEFEENRLKKHKEYLEKQIPEYKLKFYKYNKETLELIKIYDNIKILLELNPSYIKACVYTACYKNKPYKGYLWKSFKEKT